MIDSERVKRSHAIRSALDSNPNHVTHPVTGSSNAESSSASSTELIPEETEQDQEALKETSALEAPPEVVEEQLSLFLTEHAAEIEAEKDKPFQPIGGFADELNAPESAAAVAVPPAADVATSAATAATPAHSGVKYGARPHEGETKRGSALQKISKLDIKGRIQLAMKGTKEERSILIRDGTKIVALAVLESPKITDGEVETFASQKNVLEAVLRNIPMKRRYAKHYPVIRNLVFNPRTPLDVALGLMKNMLVADLKNLSSNKQISETVRKLALKMYKQKMETGKKRSD
jgi:hypothetical protein